MKIFKCIKVPLYSDLSSSKLGSYREMLGHKGKRQKQGICKSDFFKNHDSGI